MRITERRLRSIIRNVIRESEGDEEYPTDNPIFAPFENDEDDDLYDDMEIVDADEIPQLDDSIPSHEERETREFMRRNRRAAAERERGSYATRGHVHSDQIDMLDDMGELGDYSKYEH
mgnify:CR=1 FL=1|tara:strand:+ start:95 stop:448 length:354 start_codon:yes stop_codon:yes gene_type:complete